MTELTESASPRTRIVDYEDPESAVEAHLDLVARRRGARPALLLAQSEAKTLLRQGHSADRAIRRGEDVLTWYTMMGGR